MISQAAGLHITLKWRGYVNEQQWTRLAQDQGIVIRPLSYYEHGGQYQRDWSGVVLGYGNVALNDIEKHIQRLAELFES